MRFKLRKDLTHSAIARELIACGFSVADLSRVGQGCPDMLIAKHNVTALLEAKTPKLSKKTGLPTQTAAKLRRGRQTDFANAWRGPIIVAFTASQARFEFNLLLKRREMYATV